MYVNSVITSVRVSYAHARARHIWPSLVNNSGCQIAAINKMENHLRNETRTADIRADATTRSGRETRKMSRRDTHIGSRIYISDGTAAFPRAKEFTGEMERLVERLISRDTRLRRERSGGTFICSDSRGRYDYA